MAAAYGLYTHIQSNKRRSVFLLIGLFFLVYLMTFAGALIAEAFIQDRSARLRSAGGVARSPDGVAVRRRSARSSGSSSPISSISR